MTQKQLYMSIVAFVLSFFLFIAVTVAWFSISNINKVNVIEFPVGEYKANVSLEAKRNQGNFIEIKTEQDMLNLFSDAFPSFVYTFRISVENLGLQPFSISVSMQNIQSLNINPLYDMRNVYYILNGQISIDGQVETLTPSSLTPLSFEGQTFNTYRISNLLQASNVLLSSGMTILPSQTSVIEFQLVFDQNTSGIAYQDGALKINSFVINIQ